MTNSRMVTIAYVVFGLLAGFFLEHVLLSAFSLFSTTQPLDHHLVPAAAPGPGEPKEFPLGHYYRPRGPAAGGFLYAYRNAEKRGPSRRRSSPSCAR